MKKAKIGGSDEKNSNFLFQKTKKCRKSSKNVTKTFLNISWDHFTTITYETGLLMAINEQFLQPSIFKSLYIPILSGKLAKSALHSKLWEIFLAQQIFFIFMFLRPWNGTNIGYLNSFFAYFWQIFSLFPERVDHLPFIWTWLLQILSLFSQIFT